MLPSRNAQLPARDERRKTRVHPDSPFLLLRRLPRTGKRGVRRSGDAAAREALYLCLPLAAVDS
jgi:hypothetical protein